MLKLSNKGIYGIKALYELSQNYGKEPVTIKQISDRHGMPVQFLVQVLRKLKIEGLVVSSRGINGGYMLTRPPEKITIGDAVRALEGPIALCDCHINSGIEIDKKLHCVTANIYRKLGEKVENAFDSVSFKELAEEHIEKTYTGSCREG
jgi:Rrf2 family transcriptional regulator, cysteine metabolism repressor